MTRHVPGEKHALRLFKGGLSNALVPKSGQSISDREALQEFFSGIPEKLVESRDFVIHNFYPFLLKSLFHRGR